jgi:hypothetical protein
LGDVFSSIADMNMQNYHMDENSQFSIENNQNTWPFASFLPGKMLPRMARPRTPGFRAQPP